MAPSAGALIDDGLEDGGTVSTIETGFSTSTCLLALAVPPATPCTVTDIVNDPNAVTSTVGPTVWTPSYPPSRVRVHWVTDASTSELAEVEYRSISPAFNWSRPTMVTLVTGAGTESNT